MAIEVFEKEIVNEIKRGNLSIFAGAGLSIGSGYKSWKELLREIASDIGLNIDKESDLIAVAQYYYNRNNRSRNKINEKILNEFSLRAKPNPLLELVARLPVQSIWTTNYDTLIEDTLKKVDKIVDVKIKEKQLSLFLNNRDVTLYKIHGDKNTPDEAVITRDDYETFFQNRELFITNLLGELISKTFLFLGYSFGDPNFEQILSKIRYKLLDNSRTHYCFMRKIKLSECENEEEYKYLTLKNELRIEDLKNYNISTILVDEYDDILNSMKRIEFEVIKNNVFISGSAHDYNSFKNLTYGIGVGGYVIDGVMSAIFDEKLRIDDHLILRPFPQHTINKQNLSEIWESHRRGSISLSSYAIFMFGNKVKEDEVVIADGVIKEFLIAEELGKYVIPIGSTGYAAKEISTMTKSNPEKYWYLTDSYCVLDESLDVDKIYEEIVKILKRIKGEI
jgi:virulence-associated protein VapD